MEASESGQASRPKGQWYRIQPNLGAETSQRDLVREIVHYLTFRVAIPRHGRVEPVPAGHLARLGRRCGLGWTVRGVPRQ